MSIQSIIISITVERQPAYIETCISHRGFARRSHDLKRADSRAQRGEHETQNVLKLFIWGLGTQHRCHSQQSGD